MSAPNCTSKLLTAADGRDLAVAMLREAESLQGNSDASIEEQHHPGLPQNNFVVRYFETVRRAKNRQVEIGFCAILSDFISGCYDGGVADVELYEQLNDEAPAARERT